MADRSPPSPAARRFAVAVLLVLCVPILIIFAGLCVRLAEWAF